MLQVNFTAQANGNTQRNSVSGQVCKCPSYHLSMKTACPSASQFEFQVLLLPNLQKKKKAVRIAKPIQLALQKAESTERFSAFSLHVKRRRKVRSCVLPVLLLQHKDMSCGANLYQLYHWGNPMCSEDTPSNLTRICSRKFLKCQNADNLDIFRQCRRKSSSHPSQLQTLLKTACVCTQGVWFKGIDDIHQHLVSLGKLQHMFLFIRSKV